jgi:hypothetical protein
MRLLPAMMTVTIVARSASAEPPPDVDPIHAQREDAQRLAEQQRNVQLEPPPSTAIAPPSPVETTTTNKTMRTVGILIVGLAGATGLVALPTAVSSDDSISQVVLAGAAVTGAIGAIIVYRSRSVTVVPAVTSTAIGLSVAGRL